MMIYVLYNIKSVGFSQEGGGYLHIYDNFFTQLELLTFECNIYEDCATLVKAEAIHI